MRLFSVRLKYLVLLYCFSLLSAPAKEAALSRIGFGSCAKQGDPQPIWKGIRESKPDLFLLIGDNIYGDSEDMNVLRSKYAQLDADRGFAKLRKSVPLLGTWDDHDYGKNNAGVEFSKKRESQQLFLDFFRVPRDSPRRRQEGVYSSEIIGPEGKRVQIILLDTRYFRSPIPAHPGPLPLPDLTILGDTQWRWLEEQLRKPAEVRLIASSIQVISRDHGGEKWMNFPEEYERLFDVIRKTKAEGVILLSGDRHFADLSMIDAGIGYPIYDFTSSGLNRGGKSWRPLQHNPYRVAGMAYEDNFGLILIDWKKRDPIVSLQARDTNGEIRFNQKIPLSALKVGALGSPKRSSTP